MGKKLVILNADFSKNCILAQEGVSTAPNLTKNIRYGASGLSGNFNTGITWAGETVVAINFNEEGYAEIPDSFVLGHFSVGAFAVDTGSTTNNLIGDNVVKSWNLSKLDTSSVGTFAYMFRGNKQLERLSIPFNTEQATKFDNMFHSCSKLKRLDLSTFTRTTATCTRMFDSCTSLEEIVFGSNFSFVADIGLAFNNCTSLKDIYAPSVNGSEYQTSGTGAYVLANELSSGIGSTGTITIHCADGTLTRDKSTDVWVYAAS